ncbi:MAG TPA: prephenate dehydrogenase/arogenate dehydrogenase family protein [Bryobacteraceae bacterium]|nr:prephenate dehydrogenase/arogenate dehydrogenase family protein [Bryobacteraceae bacterium]
MIETVAIAGVGLIGGSFALALRKHGFRGRILGVSSPSTIKQALELGVIDEGVELREACRRAQLLYLAQPVRGILSAIDEVAELATPELLVTDAGSTKHVICERAAERGIPLFIGGHPMAGKAVRGVAAAEAELFSGRTYVFTPLEESQIETALFRAFHEYIAAFRASIVYLSPQEHDRIVAFTSHLPQLLSSALCVTLASESLDSDDLRVAGQGLIDTTRLALSSFDIWGDILATNREVLDQALLKYIDKLQFFRHNLTNPELCRDFESAAAFAALLRRSSDF